MTDMYAVAEEFAPERLEKGRVYKFRARNFFYGVWDGEGGFIGIREKFYDHYLFTEYHATTGGSVGTVVPLEATEHVVPEGIELRVYFDSRCIECEGLVEFIPDTPGTRAPGRQHHIDRALDDDHDPHGQTYMPTNRALFDFLLDLHEDAEYRQYILDLRAAGDDEDARSTIIENRRAKNRAEKGW